MRSCWVSDAHVGSLRQIIFQITLGETMARQSLPFTDKSVKAAVYLGVGLATEYRIEGNPGLVLVVRKPNQKEFSSRGWRFHYSTQRDGRQVKRRVPLGEYPSVSLAAARRKSAELMERVKREGDVVSLERANKQASERAGLTFSNLLSEYLAERAELAVIDELTRELRKDVEPALGPKRPREITASDIDTIGRAILARGAPAMASRMVMHLKALFNFIILDRPSIAEKYGVTANPAAMLGRRRRGATGGYAKAKARERALNDSEIAELWRAISASAMRRDTQLGLKLVLCTAQRPGEVRKARLEDLNLNARPPYWLIPAEISKNRRAHCVPLSPLAVALFKEALTLSPSSELVFPDVENEGASIGKAVWPTALANLFRNSLKHAEPCTVHDLRRTAATGMRRLGVSRDDVGMVLNHTPKGVTGEVYDRHDGLDEKRAALAAWSKHVDRLAHDRSQSVATGKLGSRAT